MRLQILSGSLQSVASIASTQAAFTAEAIPETAVIVLILVLPLTPGQKVPRDFFDEKVEFSNPYLAKKIMEGIKAMSDENLEAVFWIERHTKLDGRYLMVDFLRYML